MFNLNKKNNASKNFRNNNNNNNVKNNLGNTNNRNQNNGKMNYFKKNNNGNNNNSGYKNNNVNSNIGNTNRGNNNRNNNNKNNYNNYNNLLNKKIQHTEKRRKIIFILIVCLFIVVVVILGYFIYKNYPEIFSSEEEENNIKNELENIKNENNKLKNQLENELKNNSNNVNNPILTESELLNNVKNNTVGENLKKPQVFNISNNIFSYDDAEAVCKAYGAELASYDQVVDAYKSGAEWCNYGWSKNQMALYPTQKKTWEILQQDPNARNNCGEWGVNGGFFENKDTLFGVNCFGTKPQPKDREREKPTLMSPKQEKIANKVKQYKNQLPDLTVLPFNNENWSKQ